MCRWMAYSGDPILVDDLLFRPQHSIIDQSLHAQLGAGVTTNGDGFGIGWYDSTRGTAADATGPAGVKGNHPARDHAKPRRGAHPSRTPPPFPPPPAPRRPP